MRKVTLVGSHLKIYDSHQQDEMATELTLSR